MGGRGGAYRESSQIATLFNDTKASWQPSGLATPMGKGGGGFNGRGLVWTLVHRGHKQRKGSAA